MCVCVPLYKYVAKNCDVDILTGSTERFRRGREEMDRWQKNNTDTKSNSEEVLGKVICESYANRLGTDRLLCHESTWG